MADAKTFVLHVGSKYVPPDYFLEGRSLSRQTVVRDLGILLDSEFSFVDHINFVVQPARARAFTILGPIVSGKGIVEFDGSAQESERSFSVLTKCKSVSKSVKKATFVSPKGKKQESKDTGARAKK